MTHPRFITIPLLLLLGCGLPTTESDIKFAGVGGNPDEVGAPSTKSGGLVEYVWVEFAGGQLSLAALGLLSFDEAGPGFVGFKPPYAVVNGTGFVFDQDLGNPDALFGSFARPPEVIGSCQTVYEPQAYLSNVADLGNAIRIEREDGSAGFNIGRRPFVMPPVVQDIFPYYSELGTWRKEAWTYRVPTGTGSALSAMEDAVLARPNYPFGETLQMSFDGGLPPAEATYNSIPVPLAAAGGDRSVVLPQQPQGFMLEWTGPRFDPRARAWVEDGAEHTACVRFDAGTAPGAPSDCLSLPEPPTDGDLVGQVYTPPWKTTDGLTLRWEPESGTTDTLSFTVRFLGKVDETESYFVEDYVAVSATEDIETDWNKRISRGELPPDAELPQGYRASLACDGEDDVQWLFQPELREGGEGSGRYIPTLQGDPLHTAVEVTCTLDPAAGSFTLTSEMLSAALAYAGQVDAAGAVFYVARTQTGHVEVPPVRDHVGNRRDISAVTVVSKAVQVGRFWYDLGGL